MESELKTTLYWIGGMTSILVIMIVFFGTFSDVATSSEVQNWSIIQCENSNCDLSNWFAELLFGVMIGVGIFAWQKLEQRKRSGYFIGQVYGLLYPIMMEIYDIYTHPSLKTITHTNPYEVSIEKLSEHTYDDEDDILYILTEEIPEKELNKIISEFNETKKVIPNLKHFLTSAGNAISGELQEHVDKLAYDMDLEFNEDENNRYHILSLLGLFLSDIMLIMRHNKKRLKEELDIDEKEYEKLINIFLESDIFLNNFDTEKLRNYFLWFVMDGLAEKQDSWYSKP